MTLHSCGHSTEWFHLSLAAKVGVIPEFTLTYMLLKDPNLCKSEFFIEIHALYCMVKKQKKFPILIKVRAPTAVVIEERPQVPTYRS